MMIKEILMLMLLLQFSNGNLGEGRVVERKKEAAKAKAKAKCAEVAGEGEIDNICTGGIDIIKRCGWWGKVYSKICISSNHLLT